jgi:hypothetical protein
LYAKIDQPPSRALFCSPLPHTSPYLQTIFSQRFHPLLFRPIHPSSKELAETLKELLTTLVEKITAEDFWKLQAISLVVLMANQIPTSFVIGEALMTS